MDFDRVKINMVEVVLINLDIGSMFRVTKQFRIDQYVVQKDQLLKLVSKNDTTLEFLRLGNDFCDKISIGKEHFCFVLANRPDIFQ